MTFNQAEVVDAQMLPGSTDVPFDSTITILSVPSNRYCFIYASVLATGGDLQILTSDSKTFIQPSITASTGDTKVLFLPAGSTLQVKNTGDSTQSVTALAFALFYNIP